MKYLKTYMGVTSGSMAGRDDGYPEMKFRHYDNFEDLAKDFGKCKDEKYYYLTEINNEELEKEVADKLEEQRVKAVEKQKNYINSQIERLQEQLKHLT